METLAMRGSIKFLRKRNQEGTKPPPTFTIRKWKKKNKNYQAFDPDILGLGEGEREEKIQPKVYK